MFFIRVILIIISATLLIPFGESFAASGVTSSGNITSNSTDATSKTKSDDISEKESKESAEDIEEKKLEEKKTEKNAQKIILEVYKIQGNKILKDMDTSIEKVNPDPKVRIEVYSSIQKTLEFRKQKLEKSEMSDESKGILVGYIDYMISAIEKKKKTLTE